MDLQNENILGIAIMSIEVNNDYFLIGIYPSCIDNNTLTVLYVKQETYAIKLPAFYYEDLRPIRIIIPNYT
jgi:hypothetical protein